MRSAQTMQGNEVAKAPDEGIVPRWNDLMSKWEAANRNYEAAALAAEHATDEDRYHLQEALAKAMDKLKSLKREIDEVIQQGKRGRLQLPGTLVMGTIESRPLESQDEALPQRAGNVSGDQH